MKAICRGFVLSRISCREYNMSMSKDNDVGSAHQNSNTSNLDFTEISTQGSVIVLSLSTHLLNITDAPTELSNRVKPSVITSSLKTRVGLGHIFLKCSFEMARGVEFEGGKGPPTIGPADNIKRKP